MQSRSSRTRTTKAATAGPDFLCVGMLKGGTRWLYDQLQYHPDFWMPPVKELHYFDRAEERGKNAAYALKRAKRAVRHERSTDRPYDVRDYQFMREMASDSGPLDLERYISLFRHKGDRKSGDITPHYCSLERALIAQITAALPRLRVILLVRDPVARAWSQISQVTRRGVFDADILKDPEKFQTYLDSWSKMDRLSSASRAARRWKPYLPASRFRYFFMDDIANRPAETRTRVLKFLGADPAKPSGALSPDHNPKASGKKLELTEEIRAILIDHFREEIRACAKTFGGHAKAWAKRYNC